MDNDTLREIVDRLERQKDNHSAFINKGELGRLFTLGKQIELIDDEGNIVRIAGLTDEDAKTSSLVVNFIRPLVVQMIARFQEHRIKVIVNPATSDHDDKMAAKAAELIVNGILEDNNFQAQLDEAYNLLPWFGEFYIYPHVVKKDYHGEAHYGDKEKELSVSVDILHPYRVISDPDTISTTKRGMRYAFIRHDVYREDLAVIYPKAKELFENAEQEDVDVQGAFEEWDPGGEKITIWEYWEKATRTNPEGRHLILLPYSAGKTKKTKGILGTTTEKEAPDIPWTVLFEGKGYSHGQVPLVRCTMDYTASAHAGTPFEDMYHLQAVLNYVFGNILGSVDMTGNPKVVVPTGIDDEEIESGPGGIIHATHDLRDKIYYLEPPKPPFDFMMIAKEMIAHMERLAGSTPWERGESPKGNESATSYVIADSYYTRLFKPRLIYLAHAYAEAAQQIIELAGEYLSTGSERSILEAYLGHAKEDMQKYIDKDYLQRNARNVRVDVGQSGIFSTSMRLAQAKEVIRFLPPQDPAVQRTLNLWLFRQVGIEIEGYNEEIENQRNLQMAENERFRTGSANEEIPVLPTDDHITHIQVIKEFVSGLPVEDRKEEWVANLMAHEEAHKLMMMEQVIKEAALQMQTQATLQAMGQAIQQQMGLAPPPGSVAEGKEGGDGRGNERPYEPPRSAEMGIVTAEEMG